MSSSCECNAGHAAPSSSGSTPTPSRRYEVGDEVTLTFRLTSVDADKGAFAEAEGSSILNYFFFSELDAGTLVPRPIKVGDRVTWGAGQVDSEVIAIRGGEACLVDERWIGSGKPYTGLAARNFRVIPVSQLEKVS